MTLTRAYGRIALRNGLPYTPRTARRPAVEPSATPPRYSQTLLLHLVVPGQPVPKARPRVARGHAYTPARTLEAEARLLAYLKVQYPRLRPVTAPLSVSVECSFRGRPRVDVDNLLKLLLDAFNTVVWADDSQVVEAHVRKHLNSSLPRTDIHVWLLEEVS